VDLLSLPAMQRARYLAVVPQRFPCPRLLRFGRPSCLAVPLSQFSWADFRKDEQIARLALQRVDALDLAERRVGELSGGEQQRVLLARSLAQSTPILLLDEPTVHLDLQHQVSLMETVRSLAHADNLAVLVTMHDLNLAARYADRVALLVGGEVRAAGSARQVLTPELISAAYHLTVQVVPHPFADVPLVLPESQSTTERRS